jgi:hypothetical protein
VYDFGVSVTDAAGNVALQSVAVTMVQSAAPISLGAVGQLISGFIDSGTQYYFLDRNSDGIATRTFDDRFTLDEIVALFGSNGNFDDTHNSATISGLNLFIPTKIQFETIAAHHPGNLLHDVPTLSDSTFFTSTSTPNDLDLWGFETKSNLIYTVDKAYWNDNDPSSAFPHLGQVIVGVL